MAKMVTTEAEVEMRGDPLKFLPLLYKRMQSRVHDNVKAKLRLFIDKKALEVENQKLKTELENLAASANTKAEVVKMLIEEHAPIYEKEQSDLNNLLESLKKHLPRLHNQIRCLQAQAVDNTAQIEVLQAELKS